MSRLAPLIVVAALLLGPAARADAPRWDLDVKLAVDLPVTIGAIAIWSVTEGLKNRVGPTTCRICETTTSLNGFDAAGRAAFAGRDHVAPAIASDALAFGLTPALALGLDLAVIFDAVPAGGRARRYGIDVLLLCEAGATAMAVNQLSKFAVNRRRPEAIDEPVDGTRRVDENLSFFSGHSTLTFSLAAAAGTIASLRRSRLAPLVWTLGMAAATTTAILRVAADKHYTSDVLTGALIGSAIGVLVPVLHRTPITVGGSADREGGSLVLRGVF